MGTYIAKRLFSALVVLLVAAIIIFAAGFLIPGDPIDLMLGEHAPNPAVAAQVRHQYGLDQPFAVQCERFIAGLLRGDLGFSYFSIGRPVSEIIRQGFPVTARLALFALLVAILVGIPLGVSAAIHHNSLLDSLCMFFAVIGVSVPSFAMASFAVLLLSIRLGLFPVAGTATPLHFVLPVSLLALSPAATLARLTRATLLEVLREDYVRTARAKGLHERSVIYRHALRNALIPVITVAGVSFGFLLGGSFIIESFFNMPGLGWFGLQAIFQRDYPVVRGVILLFTLVFLAVNLAVDLAYGLIDPRIRLR